MATAQWRLQLAALGSLLYAIQLSWRLRRALRRMSKELAAVKADLARRQLDLKAERNGRIRAEQELRQVKQQEQAQAAGLKPQALWSRAGLEVLQQGGPACHSHPYPFRPIGHINSCFSQRNGTPRQPQLVPAARSRFVLAPDLPPTCLQGLQLYSHVWVLYVFHGNTDLDKTLLSDRNKAKGLVRVPRLDGGLMGVLGTRSPHRPNPIGLSSAQVLAVDGRGVLLGGADIVDGSPVVDIKPYVPFCDALHAATCPPWVAADAGGEEPLAMKAVNVTPAAERQLHACWAARHRSKSARRRALFASGAELVELVRQALRRDIRSLDARLQRGAPQVGAYHVILDGVDVRYEVDEGRKEVTVVGAAPAALRHDDDPWRHITKYDPWWRQANGEEGQSQDDASALASGAQQPVAGSPAAEGADAGEGFSAPGHQQEDANAQTNKQVLKFLPANRGSQT